MPAGERPTKNQRREEARVAALRMREEQQKKARRQRTVAIAVSVVAIVVVGIVVFAILAQGNRSALEDVALKPQGSTESGGIPVGADGVAGTTTGAAADAVVVQVYSDFMCPICAVFEELNGPTLTELREAGEIVVEYHAVAILDRYSLDTAYSTRSATAVALVADQAPEAFLAFSDGLFANAPDENTAGLTDAELAAIAREAGVPEELAAQIESSAYLGQQADEEGVPLEETFVPWVTAATDQASADFGSFGTPTITIDGKDLYEELEVDWRVEGALAQAIEDAKA
jgi:protein-disulfide isomerase